jgi:hypothetical protein
MFLSLFRLAHSSYGVFPEVLITCLDVLQVAVPCSPEHPGWKEHARESIVPATKLGFSTVAISSRSADAAQLLSLAIFEASPVKERLCESVAALTGKGGVLTAAALLALE